jgi:hypothetical protein
MRAVASLLWLVLAGTAAAQSLPPGVTAADRTAIQDVIRHQLDSFQHDDGPGAYAFAAPSIQRMFPDPGTFIDMVRRGYPPVYRPRSTEFSELALRDGDLVQEVELVGPDGRPALALYTMERTPDGSWLISGCALVASVRLGV